MVGLRRVGIASQLVYPSDRVRNGASGVIGVQTPRRAPNANSIAERLVRSIRVECLDHLIVINDRHLMAVLTEFIEYYNHDRPHRSLALASPSRAILRGTGRSHRGRFWAVCITPTGAPQELDRLLPPYGLRSMIEVEVDLEVCGDATDGAEVVSLVEQLRPDVVLMDIRMPRVDGIEATRRLLALSAPPKVLMLTTFDRNEYVYEAMKAGASGFLLKDARRTQLIAAIRTVATGDALVDSTITRRLIERFCRGPMPGTHSPAAVASLTERELEVLKLVAGGLSNAEIAESLVVSEATVKTHVTHILDKLELRDRVQAVVLAYESGLVEPG
jgi:DNA-binding NarL/FixJ family response regulator